MLPPILHWRCQNAILNIKLQECRDTIEQLKQEVNLLKACTASNDLVQSIPLIIENSQKFCHSTISKDAVYTTQALNRMLGKTLYRHVTSIAAPICKGRYSGHSVKSALEQISMKQKNNPLKSNNFKRKVKNNRENKNGKLQDINDLRLRKAEILR